MSRFFSQTSTGAVMGILGGIAACVFLACVTEWGHFIPSANVATDYATALVLAFGIGLALWISPLSREDRRILAVLWILRCLTTLGFMLLYENNYGLDAYTYYLEAKEINFDTSLTGFGKGTGNIGWLIWYINKWLPSSNSYHALKVIFSLIGLLSIYLIYSAAARYSGRRNPRLLLFLGAFPSVVFWSSILGKDPIMLLGISVYAAGVLYWMATRNLIWILPAFAGAVLASSIRPWTAFILALPMLPLGFFYVRGAFYRVGYALFSVALLFLSAQIFVEHFTFKSVDDLVRKTNIISRSWSVGGSRQEVPEFQSIGEMIAFAPAGMFTALLRPLPGEVRNLFGTLAGIENLFLLFLIYLSIRRFTWRRLFDPAAVWAISLLFSWSFIYSYVSYQNLGSAFRFRLQVLPLLLLLLAYLAQRQEPEMPAEE